MIPTEIQDKIFMNLLSIEETVEFFSKDYDYSKDLIELLEKALYDLNPEAIEILLYASSCNGQLDSHFTSIMTKLLLEPKILNHNLESVMALLHESGKSRSRAVLLKLQKNKRTTSTYGKGSNNGSNEQIS